MNDESDCGGCQNGSRNGHVSGYAFIFSSFPPGGGGLIECRSLLITVHEPKFLRRTGCHAISLESLDKKRNVQARQPVGIARARLVIANTTEMRRAKVGSPSLPPPS